MVMLFPLCGALHKGRDPYWACRRVQGPNLGGEKDLLPEPLDSCWQQEAVLDGLLVSEGSTLHSQQPRQIRLCTSHSGSLLQAPPLCLTNACQLLLLPLGLFLANGMGLSPLASVAKAGSQWVPLYVFQQHLAGWDIDGRP